MFALPRLHLFELEDQPWFPVVVRNLATDYLCFIEHQFRLHQPVVQILGDALRATRTEHAVDLCSGGSGPILTLQKALAANGVRVSFTLTDRFPNVDAFRRMAAESQGQITFRADSVDAKAVPSDLTGFRTIFNSFHHFAPADAVALLRDAARARQPIGVFEIPDRKLPTLVSMLLFVPLMVLLTTPFVRPFRWRRLLWTYVLPLVPLTTWWDGIVSCLRAYTLAELQALADEVGVENYNWRADRIPIGTMPGYLTYLLGQPIEPG